MRGTMFFAQFDTPRVGYGPFNDVNVANTVWDKLAAVSNSGSATVSPYC